MIGSDRLRAIIGRCLPSLILIFAVGCDSEPEPVEQPEQQTEVVDATQIESPSMQFLPRGENAEGWSLLDDPEVYPAARLDEWFSDEAEQFRAYRIVDLTVGRFESPSGVTATVELLRFPDFVQAFGAWSSSVTKGAEPLELGNRGFSTNWSHHLWRGPFYIRVTGDKEIPEPESADQNEGAQTATLESLLRSTIRDMPEAPGLPAVMRFLPSSDRIARSERYNARGGLGHPFLANSFLVDYQKDEHLVTGLILPSPSRETATRITKAFRSFYERNGRILDPVPNLGEENFTGEDEFTGRVVAFRIDRFVVIFSGFAEVQTLLQMAVDTDKSIIAAIRDALDRAEAATRARER